MKAFEFLIIENPTKAEREAGVRSKILIGPNCVLAPDERGAAMLAGREIPSDKLDKLDCLEVAVRPF